MSLASASAPFIDAVEHWVKNLPVMKLADAVRDPDRTAILSVDLINGFCTIGPLASPRVHGIVAPAAALFQAAHDLGVRHFVLTQDTHLPDEVEFGQYPPHALAGTPESETVPELENLPFSGLYYVIQKHSLSSSANRRLDHWLDEHPHVNTFIVAGDCSDLCTYQLAMHLRLRANEFHRHDVRVILPENCVQTYDTPVDTALELGIPPHHGDLLHALFLFNMANNGVEVVARLE